MKNLLLTFAVCTIVGAIAAGVLFGLAGRWDLWNIWAYLGLLVVLVTLADYRDTSKGRLKPNDPGRARQRPSGAFLGLTFLQWIIVGLDQRFLWSNVIPPVGVI